MEKEKERRTSITTLHHDGGKPLYYLLDAADDLVDFPFYLNNSFGRVWDRFLHTSK